MLGKFMSFWRQEEGATAVEYGLLAALIAGVIIVGAGLLGTSVNTKFTTMSTTVDGAGPANP